MDASDREVYLRAVQRLGWDCGSLVVATSFRDRLLGMTVRQGRSVRTWLVPRDATAPDPRLVMAFPACASVHTFGMRLPLDIAFIDGTGTVLALHKAVLPASICSHPGATAVLERFSALPAEAVGDSKKVSFCRLTVPIDLL